MPYKVEIAPLSNDLIITGITTSSVTMTSNLNQRPSLAPETALFGKILVWKDILR